ncbi:MAG TPA: ABC transporter permease subunit [Acidimicrobiales bacterium]|nr:ABC transporter permease subunit [Acidimicrobiales bacterium]
MTTSVAPPHPSITLSSRTNGPEYRRRPRWQKWLLEVGWRHGIGLIAVAFALFPILYLLQAALNGSLTNVKGWSSFVPTHPSLHNFSTLLASKEYPFWDWVINSLVICIVATTLSIFISFCAAYAFSRIRFKGRKAGLLTVLLIQMFPSFISVIALYRMSAAAGNVFPMLAPGRVSLTLIYLGGSMGLNTWLTKSYIDTIPIDLDEAAKVDGASHVQIFFTLILRLASPILVVTSLIAFIGTLNEFIFANIFLTSSNSAKTLLVGLFQLGNPTGGTYNFGMFAAGALMTAVPVVVLMFLLRNYLVGGLLKGAVKT